MNSTRWLSALTLALGLTLPLSLQAQQAAADPAAAAPAAQAPAPAPAPAYPWPMPPMAPQAYPGASPYAGNMYWVNPYWYHQWYSMYMGPWMNQMTMPQGMGPMMGAFDPRWMGGGQGTTQIEGGGVPPQVPLVRIPGFPTQAPLNWEKNTVSQGIDLETKRRFYQSMMMMNPMSLRDMFTIMAEKMPVDEGVSFEDAVESMKLRANLVNFKLVGHQPMWKEIESISGKPQPKVEIFQFCDAMVARKILDYAPEFVVFLPCRVALLEDAEGQVWVMTLDWDVGWLDYAQNPNSALDVELRKEAKRIRDAIFYIMEGAVTGDF